MTPSHVRYSRGWSSVGTAIRFSPGTSGIPFGTAHETATPSRSRRRSQCRRVALCSWTTKRFPSEVPEPCSGTSGSDVASKSRLRRYSASSSAVFLEFFVGFAIRLAVGLFLALVGETVQRDRVLAVLGVFTQELLRLLESFLLAAARLVYSLPGGIVLPVLWGLHVEALPVLGDCERGADQRQVRERLREVAEHAPGSRVELLAVETDVARQRDQIVHQRGCFVAPTRSR